MRHGLAGLVGGALLLAACEGGYLPLRGKIAVGRDPLLVFVGGPPSSGDLYLLPAAGGSALPITFSAVGEMHPALAPDGGAVAFLRAGSLDDSLPASVWVMSLSRGAERAIDLPAGAGPPERVGWATDGRSLVVRAGGRLYRAEAPPGAGTAGPLAGAERAAAESVLAVLLGRPAFAQVVPCTSPGDLCVRGDTGTTALLARGAREPIRWGDDSVAYLEGETLVVRPVGPGRARSVEWSNMPARPRQFSMFAGATAEPR
ncbi:MAG TPA: hypothetical protein VG500_03730 [Gemmatimonadales bacterium]|nr:hypothetical protein [Gemmatimonadales bacterium]